LPSARGERYGGAPAGVALPAPTLTDVRLRLDRVRPQLATEKDFLEAVNKVIKGYKKFSATPRYMTYN